MTPDEADAAATQIAEEAARLSPEEGDRLIREQTKDFPSGLRTLLLTQSSKLAEHKRLSDAQLSIEERRGESLTEKMAAQARDHGRREAVGAFRRKTFWVGVVGILISVVLVFSFSQMNAQQWFTLRLMLSGSVALVSYAFAGSIGVEGRIGAYVISAAGGFAVFCLTYLVNPPPLPPIEDQAAPTGSAVGG